MRGLLPGLDPLQWTNHGHTGRSQAWESPHSIFFTSSGVSGTSVSRSVVIEVARGAQHSRGPGDFGRDHVGIAPRLIRLCVGSSRRRRIERAWGQHHGDETAVLQDLDTPQNGNVLEQSAEVVLCIAG